MLAGPLPKRKTGRFSPTLPLRASLGPRLGPLEPRIGPLRLKIDHPRPDMGPPKHVNCLFSLNFGSERLQYLIVQFENGSPGSERGRMKFHPFPLAPPLAIVDGGIVIEHSTMRQKDYNSLKSVVRGRFLSEDKHIGS